MNTVVMADAEPSSTATAHGFPLIATLKSDAFPVECGGGEKDFDSAARHASI